MSFINKLVHFALWLLLQQHFNPSSSLTSSPVHPLKEIRIQSLTFKPLGSYVLIVLKAMSLLNFPIRMTLIITD